MSFETEKDDVDDLCPFLTKDVVSGKFDIEWDV